MKIEYRYGNLLETDVRYIAHCVNAQGKMNAGIARDIRYRFPEAYQAYTLAYRERRLKLGYVIGATSGDKIVLNIVGQEYYGRDGRRYLDYPALRKAIKAINRNIREPVAFPMIGCGLAGGDWKIVSDILETESTNFQPIVYSIDDEVPF